MHYTLFVLDFHKTNSPDFDFVVHNGMLQHVAWHSIAQHDKERAKKDRYNLQTQVVHTDKTALRS